MNEVCSMEHLVLNEVLKLKLWVVIKIKMKKPSISYSKNDESIYSKQGIIQMTE